MKKIIEKIYYKSKLIINRSALGLTFVNIIYHKKTKYNCPLCNYYGPFVNTRPETGLRKHALCPKCGSFERHRLLYLVINKITETHDLSTKSILHFSPESFCEKFFRKIFKNYTSADLTMKNVDYNVDLLNLPFENDSYDFICGSHILEYIKDDKKALSEISRVLRPDGMAIIPVPIISDKTVEYPEPNPHEAGGHIRAPGLDYFDRYALYFRNVEKYDSSHFPEKYQLYNYEKRNKWPKTMPLRPTIEGDKHTLIIPVCSKPIK